MKVLKRKQIYFSQLHDDQIYDRHLAMNEEFDDQGRLSTRETYDAQGNTTMEEFRTYANQQLCEIRVINHENDTQQRTEYKYEGDKIVNEIEHYESESFVQTHIDYNERNEVKVISKSDDESVFLGKTIYDYGENTKEINEYDDLNFLFNKIISKYDDQGNEVETVHTEYYDDSYPKADREITTSISREFDQNNNLIREEGTKHGKLFYRRTCEYDSQNNLTRLEVLNTNVNYVLVREYKYSSLNHPVEESEFRNDQKTYSKSVKYDADGLLTEELLTQNLTDNYQEITKKEVINTFYDK